MLKLSPQTSERSGSVEELIEATGLLYALVLRLADLVETYEEKTAGRSWQLSPDVTSFDDENFDHVFRYSFPTSSNTRV